MSRMPNRDTLESARRDLLLRWQEVRQSWRDSTADEFDQRFMQELLAGISAAMAPLSKLGALLDKVRSDCE